MVSAGKTETAGAACGFLPGLPSSLSLLRSACFFCELLATGFDCVRLKRAALEDGAPRVTSAIRELGNERAFESIPFKTTNMQNFLTDSWPWLLPICVLAFMVDLAMHQQTDGRSSPLAALAFVLGGPVLGVLIAIPFALKEAVNNAPDALGQIRVDGRMPGGEVIPGFFMLMITVGLVASAITALAAYDRRDQL